MNDIMPIQRKLRNKRPPRKRMIDGWYQVSAYWSDKGDNWRAFTTKVIEVHDGIARFQDGTIIDPFRQEWLRSHHIPTSEEIETR